MRKIDLSHKQIMFPNKVEKILSKAKEISLEVPWQDVLDVKIDNLFARANGLVIGIVKREYKKRKSILSGSGG